MSEPGANPLTLMLREAALGDAAATERILPLVYAELRAMASARLARTPPGNTLQATALVHEAYLKLLGPEGSEPAWESRAHFFGAAARAMRNILVDQARRKAGPKAGGRIKKAGVEEAEEAAAASIAPPIDDLLALDSALERLEVEDPRKAQVVMLKYFAGLDHGQIASALGVSVPTVERDWTFARSWLQARMERGGGGGA